MRKNNSLNSNSIFFSNQTTFDSIQRKKISNTTEQPYYPTEKKILFSPDNSVALAKQRDLIRPTSIIFYLKLSFLTEKQTQIKPQKKRNTESEETGLPGVHPRLEV